MYTRRAWIGARYEITKVLLGWGEVKKRTALSPFTVNLAVKNVAQMPLLNSLEYSIPIKLNIRFPLYLNLLLRTGVIEHATDSTLRRECFC